MSNLHQSRPDLSVVTTRNYRATLRQLQRIETIYEEDIKAVETATSAQKLFPWYLNAKSRIPEFKRRIQEVQRDIRLWNYRYFHILAEGIQNKLKL